MSLNEAIKAHIEGCANKFGTVVYRKKDGSIRRVTVLVEAGVNFI
jgi:hypothetical protein